MPRFAANLSMLFTELPFLERFAAARRAGFTAVEYLFPYDTPRRNWRAPARQRPEAGAAQPAGRRLGGGERGIACHPGRVDEFRAGVDRAILYAHALDCGSSTAWPASCPAA